VHAVGRRPGEELPGVVWHEVDLLAEPAPVAEVEPEILVHLAWYTEHRKFWTSVENVRWVEASLALLRDFAVGGGRRAVVAGTCAEYEWSREVYPETAPIAPATLYGAAKHGLRLVGGALCKQLRIDLAWGRLFFLYGPFESPGRFVPSIVIPLLRGEPAAMSLGTQRRDFVHAADAGAAFARLADSDLTGAINIGSGDGPSLREIGELIARSLGHEDLLEVGAIPMQPDEPGSLIADVGRLRNELGWRPRITLSGGLDEVIAWWRHHIAQSA
jgi:nucleoside-diphosphate-sugar epimerase